MSELAPQVDQQLLAQRFTRVRAHSLTLCEPLALEDYGVQPMADASPPKWHLAHTTWFFETFLLKEFLPAYQVFHPQFEYLFNSYYHGVGEMLPRTQRGNLSRPTVAEVKAYRGYVDDHMNALLDLVYQTQIESAEIAEQVLQRTELGLHHEQQHQELLVTDIKYNLGTNPIAPAYDETIRLDSKKATNSALHVARELKYVAVEKTVTTVGADAGFCFDNELPQHDVLLQPFALADRLVTKGEYLEFIEADGYQQPAFWLSDAWQSVCEAGWQAPLYWYKVDGQWCEYLLSGLAPVALDEPVTHVSFYEADAYARFRQCRLPTEFEWEHAARVINPTGVLNEMFNVAWQWTSSAYSPYPGYQPLAGALGEYNGKFMSAQMVLRGGSVATPENHVRVSYRNFFYGADRWQFTGIRLARQL